MLTNQMRRTCTRFAVAVAGAVVHAARAFAQADCYYTWEEIRVDGGICLAWDINNLGHVVGEIDIGGDNTLAFLWSPESGVGVLPFPDGVISMAAYAINDSGQVVGVMNNTVETLGFVWQAGVGYSVIDPPSPRGLIYVKDINNRGEVVGSVYRRTPPGPWRFEPFIWEAGSLTILSDLTTSTATSFGGINDLGDIVGNSDDSLGVGHAFVLTNRTDVNWLPPPVGATGTGAVDINNTGTVVGRSVVGWPAQVVATVWSGSTITTIPPAIESNRAYFRAVNDAGRAVGNFWGGAYSRPFVWQFGSFAEVQPLVDSPPFQLLLEATSINESGQIAVCLSSYSLRLTPSWLQGDLTGDCHVGLDDLALLLTEYGATPGSYVGADVNNDGQLDLTDLAILLSNFGI